jgi:hypothetical protein
MIDAQRYSGNAPAGSIVVRIARSGDQTVGFVRNIKEPGDDDSSYPTEQMPIAQVWRLVKNKLTDMPGAQVLVELEAGVDWDPAWGTLQD